MLALGQPSWVRESFRTHACGLVVVVCVAGAARRSGQGPCRTFMSKESEVHMPPSKADDGRDAGCHAAPAHPAQRPGLAARPNADWFGLTFIGGFTGGGNERLTPCRRRHNGCGEGVPWPKGAQQVPVHRWSLRRACSPHHRPLHMGESGLVLLSNVGHGNANPCSDRAVSEAAGKPGDVRPHFRTYDKPLSTLR